MNIGIDTDGVLTDLYGYNYDLGINILKRELINPEGYDVKSMFGVSDCWQLFHGLKYFFRYCKEWPPREQAPEVIGRLNREGHQLYEITARKFVTMKNPLGRYSKNLLKQWYKTYGLEFKEIILCAEKNAPEEKLKGCLKSGCRIMIEDKPDVAELLAENGIQIVLFDAPYNQHVTGANITRVFSWQEIYELIRNN